MQRTDLTYQIPSNMQQSLIFLLTDELFISIVLCHRLYISIVSIDFFFSDKLLYTYLIRLQTEYPDFHAITTCSFCSL